MDGRKLYEKKLSKLGILIISILPLAGCPNQNPSTNGIMTLKLSSEYILKTNISPDRQLIQIDEDSRDSYLGVFNLNEFQKKQEILESEAISSVAKKSDISFDISLNNAVFQPNDYPIYRFDVLTHPDQVRVIISEDVIDLTQGKTIEGIKLGKYEEAMSNEFGMSCYSLVDENHSTSEKTYENYFCLLENQNKNEPDLIFQVLGPNKSNLLANYNIKGLDINIRWKTGTQNKNKLNEIQDYISKLINVWNVSPNQKNI